MVSGASKDILNMRGNQAVYSCQRLEMAGTIACNRKKKKITQTNYRILRNKNILLKSEVDSVKSSSTYKDLGGNKPGICILVAK